MVLSVHELTVKFGKDEQAMKAVDNISFELGNRDKLGIVGESGCGKSSVALALMRLLDGPGVRMEASKLSLDEQSLIDVEESVLQDLRGSQISMVFQDPSASLHPLIPVGEQVIEIIQRHKFRTRDQARAQALELFRQVGIASPEQRLSAYPFELSGGMCQRVMIAMAIACGPRLLIADEPTTALDVTVQAQIIDLILELSDSLGMAVLIISHDLGVIARMADRVAVMYAGSIVEIGPAEDVFSRAVHPYTRQLLESAASAYKGVGEDLSVIPGSVEGAHFLSGCKFAPRCLQAQDKCRQARPPVENYAADHQAACWFADMTPQKEPNS